MYCESLYNVNFESELASGFSWNSSGLIDVSGPVGQPSTFDGEKGEPAKHTTKKIRVPEAKTTAALKIHSEAERRRRERINAHLETLRRLVPPSKEKVDKATLLAEVISQVKQLRTIAKQAAEGLHIPMDTDDVQVEILENTDDGSFLLRASLCCDQSPGLFPDLRKAIKDIPVRVLKCEVSTLEGRMKCVFLITCAAEGNGDHDVIANNVRATFCKILDKVSAAAEYAQPLSFPRKRQRGGSQRGGSQRGGSHLCSTS